MRRKVAFPNSDSIVPLSISGEDSVHAAVSGLWVDGRAGLRLSRQALRRLERALDRLNGEDAAADEVAELLTREAPTLRACARQALAEGGLVLPAGSGVPRALRFARILLRRAPALDRAALIRYTRQLDDAQTLTMDELWSVPEALRVAICEAVAEIAAAALRRSEAGRRVRRWLAGRALLPRRPDAAFIAQALKGTAESCCRSRRVQLEARLSRAGIRSENAVRQDQRQLSDDRVRLENLLSALRMLERVRWQAAFEQLSRVEQALRRDPRGLYGRMDAPSRAAVRRQVAHIARRTGESEYAVASRAVACAREHPEEAAGLCRWLYEDAGRKELLQALGCPEVRLKPMIPDPGGRFCRVLLLCGGLSLSALLAAVSGGALWLVPCLPLGLTSMSAILGRIYPRFIPPSHLLKLEFERLPEDCPTLVALPALLSSPERAMEICQRLEAAGALIDDPRMGFLLLGDYPDASSPEMPGDAAIHTAACQAVADMNRRAGRDKYMLLMRPRTLLKPDDLWMGRDRKRGALMALNRLILAQPGAESAFQSCPDLAWIRGSYRFVITLDADTRALPDALYRMIGAIAHPLNRRRYAVLQPRMEPLPSLCVNRFSRLFGGPGGMDTYPVAVSSLWQDMTGEGVYAGKGVYDVAAFQDRLEGVLPEGRVLSHDLIEGALAGAGWLGDVALYDGNPTMLCAALRRENRWTRGDWQLLPFLVSRGFACGGRLSRSDRFRMLENLFRSLRPPALLALILPGVWTGRENALLIALAVCFLEPLLNLFGRDRLKWQRAVAELSLLPERAWNALDAVGRTLWRLAVTRRRLMDWVTSADSADARSSRACRLPGRIAALLLAPGLLIRDVAPAAAGLMLLFLVGPAWASNLEVMPLRIRMPLTGKQRAFLTELARDTWRFFESFAKAPLPPDNVQMDPPLGAAKRTSPTNIGLYMMSALAAQRLGFVDMPALLSLLNHTTVRLEAMEKWRGHLYNWVDAETMKPLPPRYISSVDSGNLAAALLLCAQAVDSEDASLARRMRALARGMDFRSLYDEEADLFHIGFDAASGRLSAAHYDLLASESRILSFTALMLGQVPLRHWRALNRTCVPVADGCALASWSGTLFEYLMPALFMPAPDGTLLGEAARLATLAQRQASRDGLWGVSESGFYAFDAAMNYQYRAFGLRKLALDGTVQSDVIAPYAAALALLEEPTAAAEALMRMSGQGWRDALGFYEAADFARGEDDNHPALVRSHMTHHQGMALCAMCEALTGGALSRCFMDQGAARALAPLLEEKAATHVRPARPGRPATVAAPRRLEHPACWKETLLLCADEATALVTADGAAHYARFGVDADRFDGDLILRKDPARVLLRLPQSGKTAVIGEAASFAPGVARFQARLEGLQAKLEVCVHPGDGTLVKRVTLRNASRRPQVIECADIVPVALAKPRDWRAHAVFQSLFVVSERIDAQTLRFHRRPRSPEERCPVLLHTAVGSGETGIETDYARLIGRRSVPFPEKLSSTVGAVLDPCSAISLRRTLEPGETAEIAFFMKLTLEDELDAWLARCRERSFAEQALRLSAARARAALDFSGLSLPEHNRLQALTALFLDGSLAARCKALPLPDCDEGREALWAMGLSGDRPIMLMAVDRADQVRQARQAVRAHALWRSLGLEIDLALLESGEAGYARPTRQALDNLIDSSHLSGLREEPGGVWLVDGASISPWQRSALFQAASAVFSAGRDFHAQVGDLLDRLTPFAGRSFAAMNVGPTRLEPLKGDLCNGFGRFVRGGYTIDVTVERPTPAPWCNILANDRGGMLLSERGGGFFWAGNSRNGRLTPYGNDALREGWGLVLYLENSRGECLRLLPGEAPMTPFRTLHTGAFSEYHFDGAWLSGSARLSMHGTLPEVLIDLELACRGPEERFRLTAFVDWLMGVDAQDAPWLCCRWRQGACFAMGACPGTGYLCPCGADAEGGPDRGALIGHGTLAEPEGLDAPFTGGGWTLRQTFHLHRERAFRTQLHLGWAKDTAAALERVRALRDAAPEPDDASERWREYASRLTVRTPDEALNRLFNDFLIHQTLHARVQGRTGLCQPGGAYGFRDQLQDMLALIHYDPERVRAHLLRCASKQFASGDVLHWWHEPAFGARTRITDDRLFLPWVVAEYVRVTGDTAVLAEVIPYLRECPIPEGREDFCGPMPSGDERGSLHDHCMRTFRSMRLGKHGLALMGTGDWNDGMNRAGARGRGESVWLSMFAAACADRYRDILPESPDRLWLSELSGRLREAVEAWGWDGEWYLRAYADDGTPLGSQNSAACRVDALPQAWPVLADMDPERSKIAVRSALEQLVDRESGVIRLLTPPFTGSERPDVGYIQGYPPGTRENGGQYTHGALWLLLAVIRLGDAGKAHRLLGLLNPARRAATREEAERYRVEPYVMSGDIHTSPEYMGRGGWSWYTGAAGWMHSCVLALLGYERRGSRVRLNALLGDWPSASVELKYGRSHYTLICDRDAKSITLDGSAVPSDMIEMVDDGREHVTRFPPRR